MKEFTYVERCISTIESSRTFDDIEREWTIALAVLLSIRNKLKNEFKDCSSCKSILDDMTNKFSSDELLSYILHSRNCDQHSIMPIAEKGGTSTVVRGPLTIQPGTVIIGGKLPAMTDKISGDGEIYLQESIALIHVTDSRRTYAPPSSHLGNQLSSTKPTDLLKLALDYLRDVRAHLKAKQIGS
jgi:hypothetical protein